MKTKDKNFPIQFQKPDNGPYPSHIPWSVAELAYPVYVNEYAGGGQSLERVAERGGFGPNEMDLFLPDWRERCSEISSLRAELIISRNRALDEAIDIVQEARSGESDGDFRSIIHRIEMLKTTPEGNNG